MYYNSLIVCSFFCSCIIRWQTIVGQPSRGGCHVHGHTLSSAFNHSDCIWAVNELADRDDTLLIFLSLLHSFHLNCMLKLCCCHLFSLSRCLSHVLCYQWYHCTSCSIYFFPLWVSGFLSVRLEMSVDVPASKYIQSLNRQRTLTPRSLSFLCPWGTGNM